VFGVPHDRLGEEVAVAIFPKEGTTITAEDLRAYLQPKIAGFKIPTRVVIATEPLPRNAAGKFLKRELRDAIS
jgi:long-chain acyl-CoA synthetase